MENTKNDASAEGRETGREAAEKDIMELVPKLLWLQAAISAIALVISIAALVVKL